MTNRRWTDTRPRILDLFCRMGGAAAGYRRAGFHVTGVDTLPIVGYAGDDFIQADALDFPLDNFDAIHASPPCQMFSRAGHLRDAQGGVASTIDLLTPIRERLRRESDGRPYIIENVPGAPLYGVTLCGSAFGLRVRRHRVFEANFYIPPLPCDHRGQGRPVGVYHVLNDHVPQGGTTAVDLAEAQEAMGIDWMNWADLKEAIPPAYTDYIGQILMATVIAAG